MWSPRCCPCLDTVSISEKVETERVVTSSSSRSGHRRLRGGLRPASCFEARAGNTTAHLLQKGDLLFQSRGSRHPVAVVETGIRGIAATGSHVIRPDMDRKDVQLSGLRLNQLNLRRS